MISARLRVIHPKHRQHLTLYVVSRLGPNDHSCGSSSKHGPFLPLPKGTVPTPAHAQVPLTPPVRSPRLRHRPLPPLDLHRRGQGAPVRDPAARAAPAPPGESVRPGRMGRVGRAVVDPRAAAGAAGPEGGAGGARGRRGRGRGGADLVSGGWGAGLPFPNVGGKLTRVAYGV